MCNSPFKLPGQYHYDVFEVVNGDETKALFMCSAAKEKQAEEIAHALSSTGNKYLEYRVRVRPKKAHTIFIFKGGNDN